MTLSTKDLRSPVASLRLRLRYALSPCSLVERVMYKISSYI